MKVLLINNFHYVRGGSESVYFNTERLLIKNDHLVMFFSIERRENVPSKYAEYFPKDPQGYGFMRRLFNYFYNIEASVQLDKLLRLEKPDIAHLHLFWGGLTPSILKVLRKHGIPVVHSAHDYRILCPASTLQQHDGTLCHRCKQWNFMPCIHYKCAKNNMLYSVVMAAEMLFRRFFSLSKYISGFIFVSNFSKNMHLAYMPEMLKSKNIVLHNFIPEKRVFSKKSDMSYCLFLGRISHEKGIILMLDTFRNLPDIHLKLAGEGPLKSEAEQFVETHAMINVEFLGFRKGEDLAQLIQNARFVILPSTCYENNPMSILEAYSFGTPVIATAIGGIAEIVQEGKTGFLISYPPSSEKLTKIVQNAFTLSVKNYQEMSDETQIYFQREFSDKVHYRSLVKYYAEIIKQAKKEICVS